MMKLINRQDDQVYSIPTLNIESSPLLRTMLETELPVDVDLDGNIILDCDPEELEQYMNYLMGYKFSVLSGDLFKYFGHVNDMDYSLDFWEVKLHDTWVRDNCYRLSLFKDDPYYGLYEIDISSMKCNTRAKEVIGLNTLLGHYIAGGAALYVLGITDSYNDIDIFSTNPSISEEHVAELMKDGASLYHTDNSVIFPYIGSKQKQKQLILRKYSCPSEIVHGFDLGCCGVIMSYSRFTPRMWCTRRALYSIQNRCNWIEPDRSSPSYIHRLLKYSNRKAFNYDAWDGLKIRPPCSIIHDGLWTRVDSIFNVTPNGGNDMGGFKIMLTGIGDLTMDGEYYNKIVEFMKDGFRKGRFIHDITINMADLTMWLFKRNVKNAQEIIIRFIQKAGIRNVMPIPKNLRNIGRLSDKNITEDKLQMLNTLKKNRILSNSECHSKSIGLHELITTLAVSGNYLEEWSKLVKLEYESHTTRQDIHPYLNFNIRWGEIAYKDQPAGSLPGHIMPMLYDYFTEVLFSTLPIGFIIRNMGNSKKAMSESGIAIYDDPASIVLLQAMYGIGHLFSSSQHKSDYASGQPKRLTDIGVLSWKNINPMEQLTGTFHPESIDDMREWYSTSPLIVPSGISIISRRYNER